MAAVVAPPALAVLEPDGIAYTDQQLENLVNKLTTLRNDILAGSHPRLKLPTHIGDKGRPLSTHGGVTASSLPGISNSTLKPVPPFGSPLPHLPPTSTYSASQNGFHVPSQHTAAPSTTASSINPILLEKSDTLVKAEAHVKRERLEHALEDQAQQKKNMMRNKTHDEFAMPDFQVDDVLKSAHQLVQPLAFRREGPANGGGSSTDSFDENTFYSSQMNESTSTEGEVAEEPKRHVRPKLCRFYLNEKLCPYGDSCQFSHDPAMKARAGGSGLQPRDTDKMNVGEEASSRQNKSPHHLLPKKGKEGKNDYSAKEPTAQQQRIAQLEAELAAMKEKEGQQSEHHQQFANASRPQDSYGNTAVGPDEFGRDISLRDQNAQQPSEVYQHDPRSIREYSRHDRVPTPPSTNNVRVIRNHITSPYAPQPARVSPLAVAKVSQVQQNQAEGNRTSRIPYAEILNDRSPNVSAQPLNPRKRRRGRDSGEQNRNVAPRREASPQIRVKEEPVSPPSFNQAQPRRNPVQDAPRPPYVDARARPQERIIYQTRNTDGPRSVYEAENPGPPIRRIISRNGQHYTANDEPDLRRVVSERQMRVPVSPSPRYAPYPDPSPRLVRASSQVNISPTGQRPPLQYRASDQPQAATHRRSPSPPVRQMQSPPIGPPISMAPPPRRIMVDQYGNRFLEPEVKQVSVAPVSQPSMQPQYDKYVNKAMEQRYTSIAPQTEALYERQPLRSQSVRRTFGDDESAPQYIRRYPSPASPQYMEYTTPVQVVEPRGERPGGDSYGGQNSRTRVVYQEARPAPVYEPSNGQREGTYRVQSVRPIEDRYEQINRVQSVQPQPRIVQVAERQPMSPQMTRQVSLRPDDGYARPVSYGGGSQYQYAPQEGHSRGYIQAVQDDRLYDTPRIVQRM